MLMLENPRSKASEKKIKSVLGQIIEIFRSGKAPQEIAIAMFPAIEGIPSSKWSIVNRMIMRANRTEDARGFRQWEAVGRKVKPGKKAFYIFAPRFVTLVKDKETGKWIPKERPSEGEKAKKVAKKVAKKAAKKVAKEDKKIVLAGFVVAPVFAIENTGGKPVKHKKVAMPRLPLMKKAKEWGIKVKMIPANKKRYGYYCSPQFGQCEEIAIATPHEKVFFHELAHAAHKRVKGYMIGGQDKKQEIVAELSAAAIGAIVRKKMPLTLGNSYNYIKGYARGQDIGQACLEVLVDVEKVLKLILRD